MSENSGTNTIGLLLYMKKRKLFLKEDDASKHENLLFGNFDGLSIERVKKWNDFAPSLHTDETAAGIEITENNWNFESECFADTFILKLLMPDRKNWNDMDYEFWASETCNRVAQSPFFSMVMINISKDLATAYNSKSSNDLFTFMQSKTIEIVKEISNIALSDCRYALFPTLGYYDYIILARPNSPQEIAQFCNKIRKITCTEDGIEKPAVSVCYSVIGLC